MFILIMAGIIHNSNNFGINIQPAIGGINRYLTTLDLGYKFWVGKLLYCHKSVYSLFRHSGFLCSGLCFADMAGRPYKLDLASSKLYQLCFSKISAAKLVFQNPEYGLVTGG